MGTLEKVVITSDYHRDMLVLLKPYKTTPNDATIEVFETWNHSDITRALDLLGNGYIALDVETKGTKAWSKDFQVVGIGLSSLSYACYFNLKNQRPENIYQLLSSLQHADVSYIAHNLFFDGAAMWRLANDYGLDTWQWGRGWSYCTYALSKHLAGEGYAGQEWGLKHFQKTLLMWEQTNEELLDEWLVSNGYGKLWRVEADRGYYYCADKSRWGKPVKGEMWRAPASILGHYCALDALSTIQLFEYVLVPQLKRFPVLDEYMSIEYRTFFRMHIWQYMEGFACDREQIFAYYKNLETQKDRLLHEFFTHEQVAPHVAEYNRQVLTEIKAKEPAQYKKTKQTQEPAKFKKDGSISKNWEKWKARSEQPPELSKNWLNWKARWDEALTKDHFNINSDPQLRWLFYDRLGFEVKIKTDAGEPAVNVKAQAGFGEIGEKLVAQSKLIKKMEYVLAAYEQSEEDGRIHPGFKIPGTVTCRLGGAGGFNVQQQPKSREYLDNFFPDEGWSWVSSDFSSLENYVLAELSRDPTHCKFYAPDAPFNDAYLFVGANLPVIGDKIRAAGYDPEVPTPETIAETKKVCKKERQIAKCVVLASNYGAGAAKIQQTLELQGVELSIDEARAIHAGYWELYGGVKRWEKELLRQYEKNKGWLLDGFGMPVTIAKGYEKDICNRIVQRTGHMCLVYLIHIVVSLLEELEIPFKPIIMDLHDELNFQVPDEYVDNARSVIDEAIGKLNEYLGAKLPLKVDTDVVKRWSDAKCE